MPKHEFGLMPDTPKPKARYDEYEPEKYACIVVDDELIEPILPDLQAVDCFWHTRAVPGKGLAYYGVTLIPPSSTDALLAVLHGQNENGLAEWIVLAEEAKRREQFMIHFGI